jgi:hypothetical protein
MGYADRRRAIAIGYIPPIKAKIACLGRTD